MLPFCNGVTNLPSLPAFYALSPYSWTSGYGGEMQFNIMDTSYPPNIAYMAQNCMNPMFWMMYNTNLMMNPFTFSQCNVPQTISPMALQSAYMQGYNTMTQAMAQASIQASFTSLGTSIGTAKSDIEQLLQTENLPDDKKQQLEALKTQLEQLEQELQKLAQNEEGLTLEQIQERIEAHKGEMLAIQEKINELKQGITPTQPTEPTEPTEPTTPTEPTQPTEPAQPTEPTEPSEETTPSISKKEAMAQARSIAKDIFVYTDGLGYEAFLGDNSLDDKLEAAIMRITPDNVLEVFEVWEKNNYNAKTGDDSLLETIYDDIFSGDKRKEYTEHILNAFVERAEREGIDISGEQAVIEGQLNKWWRNDGKIYQAMMDIYEKLSGRSTEDAA